MVGFSSYNKREHQGSPILYLNGIVVRRAAQKNGFFTLANTTALYQEEPAFFAMRTQNPVIYGATKKLVEQIYPGSEEPNEYIRDIGALFGGSTFDRKTFVCKKTYGTSLYDFIPEYHDAKPFFDNELKLDYRAGDSVIIVGETKGQQCTLESF